MITTHTSADQRLTIAIDAACVNPHDSAFCEQLAAAIGGAEHAKGALSGIDLFINGDADSIPCARATTSGEAAPLMAALHHFNSLLRRIETLGVPVTAHLDGRQNGDTLALALACHQRRMGDDAVLALPETALGLTPSGACMARLVRLIGVQAALPLLMEGKPMNRAQAAEAGLTGSASEAIQPWDKPGYRLPGGAPNSPQLASLQQVAPAMLRQKTQGNYPAPEAILCAVIEGAQVDFDNACLIGDRYHCHVALGQVARNMLRLATLDASAGSADGAALAAAMAVGLQQQVDHLRACGVSAILIKNAARSIGIRVTPGADGASDNHMDVGSVRNHLLDALSLACLDGLQRGLCASADQADLISVRDAGLPAWTGGALRRIVDQGQEHFAAAARQLGPQGAALPAGWTELLVKIA